MMRDILFRGKCLRGGKWVYGDLATTYLHPRVHIVTKEQKQVQGLHETVWLEVDQKTVGQYTNVLDVDDGEIFEGDILLCEKGEIYVVKFLLDGFSAINVKTDCTHNLWLVARNKRAVCIGNTYDNPELAGGTSETLGE